MLLERYDVSANAFHHNTYRFLSEGPKGSIEKLVRYTYLGYNIFNLAFGDWNEEKQKLDDLVRTNNGDMSKVLATVAFTVLDFLYYRPSATILAKGGTPAKTRLYRISINTYRHHIMPYVAIKGFIDGEWEMVTNGKNYEAFAGFLKQKN